MISRFLRQPLSKAFHTAGMMFGLAGAIHAQQSGEKVVQANDPAQITDAVMISNIAVSGKAVECGLFIKPLAVVQPVTPFQAAGDWLQQMTISLVNRTDKTIAAGTVTLMILDAASDCRIQVCPMEQIQLGQMPAVDAYDGRTGKPLKPEHSERQPLNWMSGQTLTVRIVDYMDELEAKLSNYEPAWAVSKVAVHIGAFYFEDGMRWFGGYSIPDTQNPGKFKYLPRDYFPGSRGHNWPPGYNQ